MVPRGGKRKGAGGPTTEQTLLRTLAQIPLPEGAETPENVQKITAMLKKEGFRIPPDAAQGTKELVHFARAKLLSLAINPTRHAQVQARILFSLIEEACGKVPEQVKIKTDQVVNVTIKTNVGKHGATQPAANPQLDPGGVVPSKDERH